MRVQVEWTENRRMAYIVDDAESVEQIKREWDQGYESEVVDAIEAGGVEVDGGIQWDSAVVTEVGPADIPIVIL